MGKLGRFSRLACLVAALFAAHWLKAGDLVLFQDFAGTGVVNSPAYYVGFCDQGLKVCGAIDGYPYTVAANTIPVVAIYVGDPGGDVSDKILASALPDVTGFSVVRFEMDFGLDLGGPPVTCASVGGCAFIYDGSVETLGVITWGPGNLTPPAGDTTTLEFQFIAPEPGTFSLLGGALLGLAGMRRRRGRQ